VAAIEGELSDLVDDPLFWRSQAVSLAVFVTPDRIRTHRLANDLPASVAVSDRFRVLPLLRAVTFPHAAWVRAIAKGGVRLLEVGPEGPATAVDVPDMPQDAWEAAPGDKRARVRAVAFARAVDHALRGVVGGSELPLLLAADVDLASRYRQISTLSNLARPRIPGSPERTPDAELATAAREILDEHYAAELVELAETFDVRASQGRVAQDLTEVARYATHGAVDTIWVDLDANVPGSVDEASGAVIMTEDESDDHDVLDEVARRVRAAGGRVLAVRAADVPGNGPVAAILRYRP
jgi:hypothetical protein